MARTALTVTSPAQYSAGLAAVGYESADQANGNSAANDGATFLLVNNGDSSSHVLTVTAVAGPANYNTALTKTLTVAAAGTGIAGPYPVEIFSNSLLIDWDSDSSVTVAAISVLSALQTPRR